jgi:hypothetical protein
MSSAPMPKKMSMTGFSAVPARGNSLKSSISPLTVDCSLSKV